MATSSESSTSKAQRIGIWIIAAVLTIGTLGSFVIMILANDNQKTDTTVIAAKKAEYTKLSTAYQAQAAAQAAELSTQYAATFKEYASRPAVFDKSSATTLKTEDLKVGDGADIAATSSFSAYYIGWNPSAKVFDQSIDGDALKAPIAVTPGGVISGWTEGVVGMKVGGVRELTIPSDKAYGATAKSEDIPANTPLKFVIMIIPTPKAIQPSARLMELYKQLNS